MSDQDTPQETVATETAPEASTAAPAAVEPQESPEDESGEAWDPERALRKIGKVNSENKTLRERAASAEKKAASVDDLTRERDGLSLTNLRLDVGYDLGLPKSLAMRLQGNTREEMLTDAEALVELVAPTKPSATRKPTEVLRGGLEPDKEPEETDLSKIGARMFRR